MCIDFDHVQNTNTLRQALLADEYFDTQLLFVSPSGDGLKCFEAESLLGTFACNHDTDRFKKNDQIKKKIKLIETQKGNIQANIERTKEIPTLIKGSKKKQS